MSAGQPLLPLPLYIVGAHRGRTTQNFQVEKESPLLHLYLTCFLSRTWFLEELCT
jgi:hypothetical protein